MLNTMKKIKIHIKLSAFLLLLGIVVSGCGKEKGDSQIGFDAELTKAMVTDASQMYGGISTFCVANETGGANSITMFDNTKLEYSSGWNYEGDIKYWIPGYTFDFIALFPYSTTDYIVSANRETVSFYYVSTHPTDSSTVKDVLYSYHQRVYASAADAAPVPLEMKHTCALLTFKIRNSFTGPISISDISLSGLRYDGNCTIKSNASDTVSWALGSNTSGSDRYIGKTGLNSLNNLPVSNTFVDLFEYDILAVPQNVSSDIHLNLKIHPQGGSENDISPSLSSVAAVPDWKPNKHYVYTITITEERIVFDITVLDWRDDNVSL